MLISATPTAPPICWPVDSTPAAMPTSAGGMRASTVLSSCGSSRPLPRPTRTSGARSLPTVICPPLVRVTARMLAKPITAITPPASSTRRPRLGATRAATTAAQPGGHPPGHQAGEEERDGQRRVRQARAQGGLSEAVLQRERQDEEEGVDARVGRSGER